MLLYIFNRVYKDKLTKVILILALGILLLTCLFYRKVPKNNLKTSIKLAYQWFGNNINSKTKRLEYIYFPQTDTYSDTNNSTRQLIAMWSIAKAQKFLKTNDLDYLINNTINYYFKHYENNLSFEAGLILILSEFDYPNRKEIIKKLADHLTNRQQNNGSYLFNMKTKEVEYKQKGGIASGEVMLALMRAYSVTQDLRYLESLNKAFIFYRSYWREVDRFFFIQWQAQALYQLYLVNKNPEIAKYIFEINDYVIDNYLTKLQFTTNNITIMEGTIDAYLLAKIINDKQHVKKYRSIINDVVVKTLALQVDFFKSKSYKNPHKVLGGFFFSDSDPSQLIDYTFHPMNGLIKAYSLE